MGLLRGAIDEQLTFPKLPQGISPDEVDLAAASFFYRARRLLLPLSRNLNCRA